MSKVEFLDILKDYLLKSYSKEESLSILRDYEEYFLNGKLDGKTDDEIILELGSPKKIVNDLLSEDEIVQKEKTTRFKSFINRFDDYFEKNILTRKFNFLENETEKILNLKKYSIFLTLGLFFISFLMIILGNGTFASFSGLLAISIFFIGVFSVNDRINIFSVILNCLFLIVFVYKSLHFYSIESIGLGIMLGFIMVILNLIFFFIKTRGSFLLLLLTFILLLISFPLILLWSFIILITIGGVFVAVYLTPYTIYALNFLNMNYLLVVFPIILAIGLFIMMSVIIYYYSKFLYKASLYYINYLKTKLMYLRVYTNYEKKEEKNEG